MSYERILGWSLAVSILAHILILVLSPAFLRIGVPPGDTAGESSRIAREEIRLIVPVASESADPDLETIAPVPERPLARAPQQPASPGSVPRPGDATTESEGTPAAAAPETQREGGSLRIGPRDPRLWVNPREVPLPEQSDRERYMEHLQARVDAINDSISGDAERARRATDWTVTDKDGRRWGLSPEGLHVGGVTVPRQILPLPAATGDNQSQERIREEQRQRDEIRRQEEARNRRRGGDPDN